MRRFAHVLTRGEVPFAVDADGVLCRTSDANPRIVIPHNLKQRVLQLSHYPTVAASYIGVVAQLQDSLLQVVGNHNSGMRSAHPGGRKLYKTMSRHFYWPSQALDCYVTDRNCHRKRVKLLTHTKRLKLSSNCAAREHLV